MSLKKLFSAVLPTCQPWCSPSNLKALTWDLCPGTLCISAYSSTFDCKPLQPLSFSAPCAKCSSWQVPVVWPQLCSACGLGRRLEAAVLPGGREGVLLSFCPSLRAAHHGGGISPAVLCLHGPAQGRSLAFDQTQHCGTQEGRNLYHLHKSMLPRRRKKDVPRVCSLTLAGFP